MKSFIYSIASLLVLNFTINAQESNKAEPAAGPNAPIISFEKETHDFGTIDQGGDGTYLFNFKNTGKEPLIITAAQGSCGCTVPEWPKEPIMPGSSSSIRVKYDTKRIGSFTKTVSLTTNAKNNPTLTIKGNVKAEEAFGAKPEIKAGMPFENNK